MENLRKRVDVRLVANSEDYEKLVSKPSLVLRKIFNKNLIVVYKIKEVLTFNEQAYVNIF